MACQGLIRFSGYIEEQENGKYTVSTTCTERGSVVRQTKRSNLDLEGASNFLAKQKEKCCFSK